MPRFPALFRRSRDLEARDLEALGDAANGADADPDADRVDCGERIGESSDFCYCHQQKWNVNDGGPSRHQSPIKIKTRTRRTFRNRNSETSSPLKLWSSDSLSNCVTKHGKHNAIVEWTEDSNRDSLIEWEGEKYRLKQFHFHSPCEHKIDDIHPQLELHFVHLHVDQQGNENAKKILVVGVLFKENENVTDNEFLAQFFDTIPGEIGEEPVPEEIDLGKLELSDEAVFFHYKGSLTTPPCSEGVKWCVFEELKTISSEQLRAYKDLFPGENNRKLQKKHWRNVYKYKLQGDIPDI